MDSALLLGVLWYAVFVGSTVCHEAAHAWAALKLGDDTAAKGGQVSLNPIPHIRREPFGMVLMPILCLATAGYVVGWASAPYSLAWAREYPRRAGLMALAGPAANLAIAVAAGLLIRVAFEWHLLGAPYSLSATRLCAAGGDGPMVVVAEFLSIACSLNLFLLVFNLIPVPPLDGSSVLMLLMPEKAAKGYQGLLHQPVVRMIGLFVIFRGLGGFFPSLIRFAVRILYPSLHYA